MRSVKAILDTLASSLRRRNALEHEMDEELRFHLDMAIERNVRRGMAPDEARRQALVHFGGVQRYREQAREEQRSPWLENLWKDLRYAARTFARNRGFAAAVVLTLSLGIGATTAVFSVVSGVLLAPLPFPESDRITYVGWDWGNGRSINSLTAYQLTYLREHARTLDGVTTYRTLELSLGEGRTSRIVRGLQVSDDFFRVVGLSPAIGRAFTAEEQREGGASVMVLGDALWRTAFGADSSIVGRAVRMDGVSYVVVGVMPRRFSFPGAPDQAEVILPLRVRADPRNEGHNYEAMTRVARGVTPAALEADLAAMTATFRADHPDLFGRPNEHFLPRSFEDLYVGSLSTTLWVLLGAVSCVLLIACVNAAGLLLARGAARTREIAVRTALGAGRARIVRQLVTEGLALTFVAGILGCAIGLSSVRLLLALAPGSLPRVAEIGLDGRVLAVTLAVVTVTGILFGVAAAAPTARRGLSSLLGERAPGGPSGGSQRLRDLLVVGETGLTLVLLAGAGLLVASFANLRRVNAGFSADGVVAVRVGRMPDGYDRPGARATFERTLLQEVRRVPGVEAAGAVSSFPLERGLNMPVAIEGRPDAAEGDVQLRAVTAGALEALRVPLLRGRAIRESDDDEASHIALVSESFVRRYFPNEDPIGRRLEIGRWKDQWIMSYHGGTEIVGVVGDVRDISLAREARRTVWVPLRAGGSDRTRLVVRSTQPSSLRLAVERTIASLDPRVTPPVVTPLSDIVGASLAAPRFQMIVLAVFAGSALLLTAIGLFGLMAYTVQRRVRELGVRIALGARPESVFATVVGRGMLLVTLGCVIGLAASLLVTRFLRSLLYGVAATDATVFAVGVCVLVASAFLACYLPARRAARIDPIVALRAE